jgi:hypothetical protein
MTDRAAVEAEQPAQSPADAAVDRYLAGLRRGRIAYAVAVTVVVAALVVTVAVMWSRSEVAHVRLRIAKTPAAPVQLAAPSGTLHVAWQSADRTAIGTPNWLGTVVTYSEHTVRGRDGRTGNITWSYSRSDRSICQVAQDQGVAIAVYRHKGNCDEVTALDATNGQRRWTRTLDQDANPVNGTPAYLVTQDTVMFTVPNAIYAIDPQSGIDRWTFAQQNCTIRGAALGSTGALISQTCSHVNCTGLKFCANGAQLLLRDPTAGHSDDASQKANPDQIKWLLPGNQDLPVSADTVISALEPGGGRLDVFDGGKGTLRSGISVDAAFDAHSVAATSLGRPELLWSNGTAYAIDGSLDRISWTAETVSRPQITPAVGKETEPPTELADAALTVASDTGIALLDGASGKVSAQFSVAPPPRGSIVYRFGSGFLVAGATTVAYA